MRFFKKPGCAAQRCDVDGSRLERRVSGAWRLQCRRFVCLACLATARARARARARHRIPVFQFMHSGVWLAVPHLGLQTLNFERSANHRRRTHCRSLWSLLRRARKTRPDDFRSASTRGASRPKPSMRRRPSRRGAPAPLFIAPRVPRTFVQHPHHTFTRATALRTGDTRSRHAETGSAAAPELIDAAVAGIASAALPGRPYTRRRRSTRGEAGRIRLARPTTPRHATRACLLQAREPACPPAPAYADRAATNAAGYAGPRVATSLRGDARDMRASTPRSCACTAHAARPNVPFHGVRACGGVDERDIDRRAAIRRHRIPDARPTFDRGFPPSRHGAPGHARIQTTSNSHRMHVQLTLNRHLIHIQNTL